MFDGRKLSELQITNTAAMLVVTGILAAPALATTSQPLPCKDASEVTLHVHIEALTTEVVSHNVPRQSVDKNAGLEEVSASSASDLLAPRAEAAIRDAFEDSEEASLTSTITVPVAAPMAGAETKTDAAAEEDDQDDRKIEMTTKLPGISDDDLSRYRKQMYRRDI